MEKISHNKAISNDLINDQIFKLQDKNQPNFKVKNVQRLLNEINRQHKFPSNSTTGRLIVFNKENTETTDLDRTRPITINSVILKIYEQVILNRLMKEINDKHILNK